MDRFEQVFEIVDGRTIALQPLETLAFRSLQLEVRQSGPSQSSLSSKPVTERTGRRLKDL